MTATGDLAERISEIMHQAGGHGPRNYDGPCHSCLPIAEQVVAEVLTIPTPPTGAELIAAERRRQVEEEGYTLEHDRKHGWYLLERAADALGTGNRDLWPEGWDWKPKDWLSDLIRAGALYLAAAEVCDWGGGVESAESTRCSAAAVASTIDAVLARAREVLAGGGS